ncbi:MAG: DUF3352 domain-containing protein [Oscillatoriaceae bacterium SKW80]|nr:DUF3352 domain-containing protein [Oscillatoriaceae bacterium SKYG93]MCX8119294.1 DUF3352 domain-containing protein [Oscillatoriaceae bacterium SKW80]MDW8454761.1 hypothetical protein [Oscillatoriaceae cyanobacterium SKYGB_i_bin93]HIK28458.1 hypothetical protein [Oscillatoriaceae cyanobacterium M7585_C2015_266]
MPFLPPDINFVEDVQPWVGEWTELALLPVKSNTQTEAKQKILAAGILMIALATDAAAFYGKI